MSLETVAQEFLQYGNNQSGNGQNGTYSTKSKVEIQIMNF